MFAALLVAWAAAAAALIDRRAVVSRHNPTVGLPTDPTAVISLGNGAFAFNVDATGLQSLNASYSFDLNTLADWGWHTSLAGADALQAYNLTDFTTAAGGNRTRRIRYPTGANASAASGAWTHANPHRLPLGQVSLAWAGGGALEAGDVASASLTLDAWAGEADAASVLRCEPRAGCGAASGAEVEARVRACVHPDVDALAVRVALSPRARAAALAAPPPPPPLLLRLAFPYTSGGAADWAPATDGLHTTEVTSSAPGRFVVARALDGDGYTVTCAFNASWAMSRSPLSPHVLLLSPPLLAQGAPVATDLVCLFAPRGIAYPVGARTPWLLGKRAQTAALLDGGGAALPGYERVSGAAAGAWAAYWGAGAFVDLAGASGAPAAVELERRVVRSLYLLRALEAGAEPPAETGLLLAGGWAGKHHGEMRYWHQAWAGFWGRVEVLARSDAWYDDYLLNASSVAAAQGYAGARWPKMVAAVGNRSWGGRGDVPWVGLRYAPLPGAVHGGDAAGLAPLLAWESSSAVGPLLVWQQAHSIHLAEAQRRAAAAGGGAPAAEAVMRRLLPVVTATADFLASFAVPDGGGVFHLRPPLFGGEEGGDPGAIFDPAFELVQINSALDTAAAWRAALALPPVAAWDRVRGHLAAPPFDPATRAPPLYAANAACACLYAPSGSPCGFARTGCPAPLTSHPMAVGVVGMLNGLSGDGGARYGVSAASANATAAAVRERWSWGSAASSPAVWGWDAPLLALSLARLRWAPEAAVGALLAPFNKNLYSDVGVNQGMGNATAYFPGNGGTLLAVAALAAGFDGGAPGAQLRAGGAGAVAADAVPGVGFPGEWRAVVEGFNVPLP